MFSFVLVVTGVGANRLGGASSVVPAGAAPCRGGGPRAAAACSPLCGLRQIPRVATLSCRVHGRMFSVLHGGGPEARRRHRVHLRVPSGCG
eukprot:2611163-Prymnesium_polylepis.1